MSFVEDHDAVRQTIISSAFAKLNAEGPQQYYVAHIKVWEEAPLEQGRRKQRYVIVACTSDGSAGFIHKAKLNVGHTFSIGKTWRLETLRGVEVVSPRTFEITLDKAYRWQTSNERDQANFVNTLVRTFRSLQTAEEHL